MESHDCKGADRDKNKGENIEDIRNPLLDRVFNKFGKQIVPELSQEPRSDDTG